MADTKQMIPLFHINQYTIDTSKFSHMLHGLEQELEGRFAEYVGAKYACAANSATSLITLAVSRYMPRSTCQVHLPSIIPCVVPNAVLNGGANIVWKDDINWVGHAYTLFETPKIRIIDSAQQVLPNQYHKCQEKDLVIYSFYPTKPIGGMDGGIIVSNNKEEIDWFRTAIHNGMSQESESWKRKLQFPGWKMHMNSSQAYVILQNLDKYDDKLHSLYKIQSKYDNVFNKLSTSHHLYRINVNNRDEFIDGMTKRGISTGIHYHAAHQESIYNLGEGTTEDWGVSLKQSEYESKTTVSIPFNERLKDDEVDYIIKCVGELQK